MEIGMSLRWNQSRIYIYKNLTKKWIFTTNELFLYKSIQNTISLMNWLNWLPLKFWSVWSSLFMKVLTKYSHGNHTQGQMKVFSTKICTNFYQPFKTCPYFMRHTISCFGPCHLLLIVDRFFLGQETPSVQKLTCSKTHTTLISF